jgi:hypothetical protein
VTMRELETAVAGLSPTELESFAKWFDSYLADAWDRRIEEDIRAGRLDAAARQADQDFETGKTTPMPFGQRHPEFKGAVPNLPTNLAKQHEHYRLGTPNR